MIHGYFTPPCDNKAIGRGTFEAARRLVARKQSFLALFSLIMLVLLGCVQPLAIKKATTAEMLEAKTSGTGVYTDQDDQMWLRVGISPETSRSLTNYPSLNDGLRKNINYYQLIELEDGQNGISGFADWLQSGNETQLAGKADAGELQVPVSPGKTYHLLLLMGHKDDANDKRPILLASGYRKETISGNFDITFKMIPLFVDMKFIIHTTDTTISEKHPSGNKVEVNKEKAFDVQVSLFGKVSGSKVGSGDGLWPLKLAETPLRTDGAWWDAVGKKYMTFYGESLTPLDMNVQTVTLKSNKGTFINNGIKSERTPSSGLNYTGDSLKYSYGEQTSFDTASFNFELEYVPFALDAAAAWPTLTEAPVWLIANWLGSPKNPDGSIPEDNGVLVKEPGGFFANGQYY